MRVALSLYLALLALIAVNLAYVLTLPPWGWALCVAGMAAAVWAVWRYLGTRQALLSCLMALGLIGLLAVAGTLMVPAWQVIADGASTSWAGRMAPMFVAALALYGTNLWMAAAVSVGSDEPLEHVARYLDGPRLLPALITGAILCASFVLTLEWLARGNEGLVVVTGRFLERGIIPPTTVLLFFWGVLILVGKWWNALYLGRALKRWDGQSAGELATAAPAAAHIAALSAQADRLDEGLRFLWRRHEESYLVPRYISWAVPILGFIGTVLGISLAADGIRRIIASESGLAGLSSDLGAAISPLGIAFDTTLIALSLSLVLTLVLSLVQRGEERTLTYLEWRLRAAADGR